MDQGGKEISMGARAAAFAALAVSAIVLVVALGGALSGGGSDSASNTGTATPAAGQEGRGNAPARYEVEEGDTLSAISEATGVSVARIEELNPGLDPQALTPGQELRLR